MLFHALWYATTDVTGLEDVRGEWTPMPIGARVLYLPTPGTYARSYKALYKCVQVPTSL